MTYPRCCRPRSDRCAPSAYAAVTASGCAQALLCLAFVLGTTSIPAAEPNEYLGERFQPFASVPAAKPTWFFQWEQHGRSTQGRPIETIEIGEGPFRTLVLGSLHGSETMAVEVVGTLATHLGKMPDHWHTVNALIVRTPNPDGFAKHSSLNARGVDLNRNFPASPRRTGTREMRAGTSAFSEIETRTVRELLSLYRPHRVVHVKSTRNASGWVLCNRQAQAAAAFLSGFPNLHVGRLEDHLVTGSLESYAAGTLGLETITLAVPNRPDKAVVWRDYRNALLAATAYVDPAWRTAPRQADSATKFPRVSAQQPNGVWNPATSGRRDRGLPRLSFRRSTQKRQLPLGRLWQRRSSAGR